MARFFKYKTPDALVADARARGLDVPLSSDFSPLLEPTRIHGRDVGNRLAIHPMEGCDGEPDGRVGVLTLRRYRRFGAGGAKLIWGEAAAVVPEGRANPRQLVIGPAHVESLRSLLESCRQAHRDAFGSDRELLVGLQLTHSGRYSYQRPVLATRNPILDQRTYLDKAAGLVVPDDFPVISDDELQRLQDHYVAAARLALEIGFDFVDVKQCHGYLLNELLGARNRPGQYGGSFENRTRFLRELVGRILGESPGAIVATRLNLHDGLPFRHDGTPDAAPSQGGMPCGWGVQLDDPQVVDLAEPLALVGLMKEWGVTLVNATMGNPYANPHVGRPYEAPPVDGYESPEHPLVGVARHLQATEIVQNAHPGLAIVGTGYSWLQEFALHAAAATIRDRRATLVGLGRATLSQPDFARRLMEGQPLDRKRTCRTFSYCTALMRSKHNELGQFPTGCPPFDKDVYGPIWDDARKPHPTN